MVGLMPAWKHMLLGKAGREHSCLYFQLLSSRGELGMIAARLESEMHQEYAPWLQDLRRPKHPWDGFQTCGGATLPAAELCSFVAPA